MIPINTKKIRESGDRCEAIGRRFMEVQVMLAREGFDWPREKRHAILSDSLKRFADDLKSLDSQESALTIIMVAEALRGAAPAVLASIEDAILLSKFGEDAKSQLDAFKLN